MNLKSVRLAAILLTCFSTFFPRVVAAQISAGANTNVIAIGQILIGNDIAYDPDHDIFLSVAAYGPVYGVFVSPAGGAASTPFRIGSANSSSFGHYPRTIYSRELGGFVVAWHQDGYLHSLVVSSPSGAMSAERLISDGSQIGTRASGNIGLAYSYTSHKFLVTWTTNAFGVQGRFLDSSGVPSGPVTQYVDAPGAQEPQLAWNSATDEFGLVYGAFNNVAAWAGFKRVPASGAPPSAPTTFGFAPGVFSPSISVNPSTSHYVLGWSIGGGAKGTEFDQSGNKVADDRFIASRLGTPTSFELAYNAVSNTFLAVSEDPKSVEVAGIELQGDGSPIGIAVGLSSGATSGSFVPRLAARTSARDWSISYTRNMNALANQVVSTGTNGTSVGGGGGTPPPPPPPPPPTCTYSLDSAGTSVAAPGGVGYVTLRASASACAWTAGSNAAWLGIGPGNGTGTLTLTFSVAANLSLADRSGTITIGGQTFTIAQKGLSAAAHDINGDGLSDLMWQHQTTGDLLAWYLNGTTVTGWNYLSISRLADPNWKIAGTGDLNGDGYADIVWQHSSGYLACWMLKGPNVVQTSNLSVSPVTDTNWKIRAVTDANGDGKADLIWQHDTNGGLVVWFMNGNTVTSWSYLSIPAFTDLNWKIAGGGDLNGDGKGDIVWHNQATGEVVAWMLNGATVTGTGYLSTGAVGDTAWKVRGVGDVNGDGRADLIWQNTSNGGLVVWFMNGYQVLSWSYLSIPYVPDTNWSVVGPG
jgi:hypothetical protein